MCYNDQPPLIIHSLSKCAQSFIPFNASSPENNSNKLKNMATLTTHHCVSLDPCMTSGISVYCAEDLIKFFKNKTNDELSTTLKDFIQGN